MFTHKLYTAVVMGTFRARVAGIVLLLSTLLPLRAQSDDPNLINITNLEQLNAIRFDTNGNGAPEGTKEEGAVYEAAFGLSSNAVINCTDGCLGYELMNDLDFAGTKWENPDGGTFSGTRAAGGWGLIGYFNSFTDRVYYTAVFDGRGHTISNLYINRPSTNYVGLFGVLGKGADLRNLRVEGGSVNGSRLVGGLVGQNDGGTISDCYATGDVTGTGWSIGGLVGQNNGTISDCYATGDVTGTDKYVGGLVGRNDSGGPISDCYASGSVNGDDWVGGLVGWNRGGTISACYATGNATGTGDDVGGLVGVTGGGTISACYATGDATGTGNIVGGLVGWNDGGSTISACYATGNVTGGDDVGGLVGSNSGSTTSACYATGNATGTGNSVGGLVGSNLAGQISACYATGDASGAGGVGGLVGNNNGGTISACYATGDASGSSAVGGLVGSNIVATVTNSYFDHEASNRPVADTYSKTTADLQTPTAYGTAMEIYATWNVDVDNADADDDIATGTDDPWNFGTASQYPAIKGDLNGDDLATAYEFGVQGRDAPPTVEGFTPASGAVSTSIKIWGTGFSSTVTENSISFGGSAYVVAVTFIEDTRAASPTIDTLEVSVPSDAHTGRILVKVLNLTPDASLQLFVLPVTISSISPLYAPVGASVTIEGTQFVRTASENEVSFGGSRYVAAQGYTDSSPEELSVTVPSDARTGLIMLRVANETPVSSTQTFNVLSVTGFSPSSASVGEDVKIWGTGFSSTATEDSVSFGEGDYVVAATFIEDTRTGASPTIDTLIVPVPMGVNLRRREIRVKVLDGAHATSSGSFGALPSADRLINITTLEQLNVIRHDPDGDGTPSSSQASAYRTAFSLTGTDNNTCPGGCVGYELMNNLDFAGTKWEDPNGGTFTGTHERNGWKSIGIGYQNRFTATFEGNSHTISNLYINRSGTYNVGLFGYLDREGHLRNIEIEGGSVTGGYYVGGLLGYSRGAGISGCSSSASVTGNESVGGLVGYADPGTISGSSSSGSVTGNFWVGGLVGWSNESTINACYATGTVTGNKAVGGLVGNFFGERAVTTMSDCYATGDVIAEGNHNQAGGLLGKTSWAIVLNCYATGDVMLVGDNGVAGGLVGLHESMIRNGYARGNVEIRGENGVAGGLVGHSGRARMRTSYATGNVLVVGGNGTAGGLAGYNRGGRELATITACYSTGQAIASENAGGLVGISEGGWLRACYSTGSVFGENIGGLIGSGEGFVEYSYFDHEASNRPETDAYAKSSDELHSVGGYTGIYENWGLDIDCDHRGDDIWNFVGDDKYPKLKLDFNGDLSATASEFGEQLLVFVDADGREMLSPVFSVSSGATGVVGTLRGINSENDNAAQLALEGMSDVFELASNGELSVQSSKEVSHVDAPYTVLVRLTEGTRSVVRSVSVQVAALNDNDSDGLIDVTTLGQLHAIHFDLNGDGMVDASASMADSIAYEDAFGLSRKESIHCVASCVGYELMNSLDFNDIDATMMGDQPSIWSENCTDGACQTATAVDGDNADKVGWEPIGYYTSSTDRAYYTATFEGNDHTISNLYINRSGTSYVGLFGVLGTDGNVRNLGMEGGSLSGAENVGGLVGYNEGTVSACYTTGNASGTNRVGGLAGSSSGTMSASYATGTATGTGDNVGGLVGFNASGTISDCYATGNATGTGDYVGGLSGNSSGIISACYATGDATGGYYVGGLVGENTSTISACYATGAASGDYNVGGLVGFNDGGTISACYATGDASGSSWVGGLVGWNEGGAIRACYATGAATGTGDNVGGLVGWNNQGPISACYATGNATGTGDFVGGLVGDNGGTISACYATGNASGASDVGGLVGGGSGTATNSYFDSETSGIATGTGAKTTAQLQTPTAYGTAMEIYANWNVDVDNADTDDDPATGTDDPWDFGTDSQYPALKVDFNGDGETSVGEFGRIMVHSFSPERGSVGTTVTITGTGFSTTVADNMVVFLGAEGDDSDDVVAASTSPDPTTTSLTVAVPANAKTGKIGVALVGGSPQETRTSMSMQSFTVLMVSGFTPTSGLVGTEVKIWGTAFSSTATENSISFGGSAYVVASSFIADTRAGLSPTVDTLVVSVPSDAQTGKISVKVLDGMPAMSTVDFTVTPVVSSFTPTSGAVDTEVKIWGTSFSSTATEDSISFGGSAYVVASSFIADTRAGLSPTVDTLVVSVPSDAQTGKISVKVLDGMPAISTVDFTVTVPAPDPPVVSSFTPTSGAVDETVMITGTGFSATATDNTVVFLGAEGNDADNAEATVSTSPAPTATSLSVSVPSTAQTGKISVMVGTAADTSAASFTVTGTTPAPAAPAVSSFTPTSGAVDETVMITGTGFSATATDNTVVFLGAEGNDADNAEATVSTSPAPTATSLSVSVPSTAQTGKISVMVGTAADTSAASFTVTGTTPAPAAPVVSSFSPTEGVVDTEVTITGVNFSATPSANEVRFGGVMAADPTSASTTSLTVLVPSGAVTGRVSVAVGGQTGTSSTNFTVTAPAPAPAAPVVSSFSPTEGVVDTEVTITGVNFSDMSSENDVRFGGVMAADPTSASTTSLTVLVPSGAVTGRVSVTVGGQTGTSSEDFTVTVPAPAPDPPVVLSFSPSEGEVGISVTITGENFSDMPSENEVGFGGVMAAAPTSASTTSLTVRVPSGAVTGRVSVAVGGQTGTSSEDFTVTGTVPAPDPPVVLSFSPSEGVVGTSVTITGENFSDMPSENEVGFGGVMAAAPTSASTTSLTILVPSGARTGRVSVAVGGQTGTSSTDFTVTAPAPAPDPPVVLSFSPLEGEVGISVTITGENFSDMPSENEVGFGGVMAAAPTSASTTSLTILVPSGARTGRVSVAVGGQTGTSSTDFTVTAPAPAPDPPVVLSFSPLEGEVGISVTITGENFSDMPSENEVGFGGVMAAAPTSASTTSLTILVPSGARTGRVSVAVGGQTGTSSTDFTVTGTTPVSPFSVPLSSEGDVRVYPNPTSGRLHFKGLLAGGRYVCDLYSLVGQKVLSSVVRAGDMMDTSTLSSGQYILILQAEGRELMRTRLLVVR